MNTYIIFYCNSKFTIFIWSVNYYYKAFKQTSSLKYINTLLIIVLKLLESSFVHVKGIPKTSKTRAAHDCQRRCLLFDKFLPPTLSLLYFARAALPLTIQKACYPPRYYCKFSCYENWEFKVVFSFLEQLQTESSTLINTETTFNGQSVRRVNQIQYC